jgi:hypothetical protein
MKILSKEEGEKWLLENKLPIDIGKLRFLYDTYIAYELPNPPETGIQTWLAKRFVEIIGEIVEVSENEGAFWIFDRFPDDGNMNLFDGYRKSLNENRKLEEAPFHIFNKLDLVSLECLLDLTLFFGFFALLIFPGRKTVIYIQEEWFVDVSCESETDYEPFRELFEGVKLKRIKEKINRSR